MVVPRQPWGEISESGWTYFGSILFTVILFMLFHLKYEKKMIRRPKNLKKSRNAKVRTLPGSVLLLCRCWRPTCWRRRGRPTRCCPGGSRCQDQGGRR